MREARRWVASRCVDFGRPELSACAETGVSELVTNALLHACAPIQVSVAGTRGHLRVEVRDSSTQAPSLPQLADLDLEPEEDDLPLLTFGRGLGIVARSSLAWGADIDIDGKVVWFEPAEEIHEAEPPEGRITGLDERRLEEPAEDLGTFELRGVPIRLLGETLRHHRELRREVRLLALSHGGSDPLARDLSDVFAGLDRPLREAQSLIEESLDDDAILDLRLRLPRTLAAGLGRLDELLDLADTFAQEGQLLSPARTGEQRSFQRWFLSELVRQSDSLPSTPWLMSQAESGGIAGGIAPSNGMP